MATTLDGLYRYGWIENLTPHSTFFNVTNGIIEANPQHDKATPVGKFNGKPVLEFFDARRAYDWPHKDDRCLQVNLAEKDA